MHARVSRGAVTAVAALLAPAFAPAQQVWTVTNQTQLLAAIAAAAPGDVVRLVETGTSMFAPFTLDKGLTLRGPATIGSVSAPLVLVNVPSGQVAQFVDLTFQTMPPPYQWSITSVSTVEVHGTARFDSCQLAYLHLVNAEAVIERCQIDSNRYATLPAIEAKDSIVSVHGCTLRGSGSTVYPWFSSGGPGILAYGSGSLHVSTSSAQGGWGNYNNHGPGGSPAPGIQTSVPTWLSDTTVAGGDHYGMGPGAIGLVVNGATTYTARCTIFGGLVISGVRSPAISGNAVVDRTLLGVRMTPLYRGQPASIDVIADQPGTPLAVFSQVGLNDPQVVPYVTQPLWLGNAAVLVAAGLSGSNSELSLAWQTLLDPTFENVAISFVGVGLGGAGVQVTPTAGGLIR